ncbi:hypothetical protein ACS0TY_035592 [Phlomoides rotata]
MPLLLPPPPPRIASFYTRMPPYATASFQTKALVKVEADDSIVSIRRRSRQKLRTMAPPPGPYSGKSSLAMVARASLFTFRIVYGIVKLKYLKMNTKSQKKAEAKGHH